MFAYPLQVLNFAVVYFMQQSFVSTAPTYGDSQAKVQGNYFLIVPAVPGNYRGFYIRNFTPVRFPVVYGGAKSRVVTISIRAGLIPGL